MPKDTPTKQFRKGTKSCVECRQRKLRCIPAADESQPCQNCEARGRKCVLQVHVGRSSDTTGITSRDRISQLEMSVGSLWTVVRDLKTDLGHPNSHTDPLQDDGTATMKSMVDSDSDDASDLSPMNPPTHLQQLFDNEFLDSHANDAGSSDLGSEKASHAQLNRARIRLQALIPSKDDVRAICGPAFKWMPLYNTMFPTINAFSSGEEMLAKYDSLQDPNANPIGVAALLVSLAITLIQRSTEGARDLTSIADPMRFVRSVSETVEVNIVSNDNIASSIEGIEITLLCSRLQLVRTQTKKLWLMLRRVIALAELIGLPRAAQRAQALEEQSRLSGGTAHTELKLKSASILWKSICSIDRIVGVMFNLPLGTSNYGFPTPRTVIQDGRVVPQDYVCYLAIIGQKIQDIDEAYISQRPETELIERVFKVEQDLRSLSNMTPASWWSLTNESPLPDHLVQYWFHYFTVRAHLQLALRNGKDSQYMYSYMACSQASRALAGRYVTLRSLLPPAFFAGRLLDLQALTAAVFLLYTNNRPTGMQRVNVQNEGDNSARELAFQIVDMMESVSNEAAGEFGRQAATAVRALDELLSVPHQADAQKNLTLRIPMLGKVSVNVHLRSGQTTESSSQHEQSDTPASGNPQNQPVWQLNHMIAQPNEFNTSGYEQNELLSWSMDLMMDDFPPLPEDTFTTNQWLSFNNFNTNAPF